MRTVRQLLAAKPQGVWHVSPRHSVLEALQMMSEKGVGALVVMNGETLAGIVSERDYARKVALRGKSSIETSVADIMNADVLYVTPDHTTDDCMALMTEQRIRHLPVLDHGAVVGILSIGDLVKTLLDEQNDALAKPEQRTRGN